VVIRKYENRRLYDTASSRYVNLEEIAEMVRSGVDVQVVDAVNGEDLTRLVLTQIIVEDAKAPDSAFPLDMLRQMVVASGRVGQESMLKYMKAMFDMYQTAYRSFPPPLTPFDFLGAMGAGARAPEAPRPAPPEPPQAPAPEPGTPPGAMPPDGVDELRKRIEELESLVARPAKAPAARKRAKTTRRR
jgi:polyhydroxyalkanoate synthesis repressor PhaR